MRATNCIGSALADWRASLQRHATATGGLRIASLARLDTLDLANLRDIELAVYVNLLEELGAVHGRSWLAWATGCATIMPFGDRLGGTILGCCRTLGTALDWLCRFFPLYQDASILRLELCEDFGTLSYRITDPTVWPRHEDAMYKLGICAALVKAADPDAWGRVQLTVEAEEGQVGADLEAITRTRVNFGGHANAIRFPTDIINEPLHVAPRCNPGCLKHLSAELTELQRATPIAHRIRQSIYKEMSDGSVSQANIARELGVCSRTLRRRLSAENRSFRELLDECRMQFAVFEFRTRNHRSLSDLALKLGYSEHSTFSRAFVRWTGMPPNEYRRVVVTNRTRLDRDAPPLRHGVS